MSIIVPPGTLIVEKDPIRKYFPWYGKPETFNMHNEDQTFWLPEPLFGYRKDSKMVSVERGEELLNQWLPPAKCYAYGKLTKNSQYYGMVPEDHTAPYAPCSCGFYSYKTEDRLKEQLNWNGDRGWRVELRGIVIEHRDGYRAQFMRYVEEIPLSPTYIQKRF